MEWFGIAKVEDCEVESASIDWDEYETCTSDWWGSCIVVGMEGEGLTGWVGDELSFWVNELGSESGEVMTGEWGH